MDDLHKMSELLDQIRRVRHYRLKRIELLKHKDGLANKDHIQGAKLAEKQAMANCRYLLADLMKPSAQHGPISKG